jgi:membrane-associated protease RseP (regulator of RpoE activity)
MKSDSIPFVFALLAVVMLGLVVTPSSYAQLPPTDLLNLRQFPMDPFVLRGPGSQIGVSTRELKPPETDWRNRLRAFVARQRPIGVIIEEVHTDSPASRAGLVKGDIIIEFDGQPVRGVSQFYRVVEETPPGWTVTVIFVRDANVREIPITPTIRVSSR